MTTLPDISLKLKRVLARSNLAYYAQEFVYLENGKKFSFANHEYLQEFYLENHPYVVVQKGTQMSITTWAFIKSIWLCLNILPLGVIYFFPTQKDVSDFSRGRITPFLNYNQSIKLQDDDDVNNVGMKHIGNAYLYFRGMMSSVSTKAVPADGLIFDEIDEAPPQSKEQALKRIDHSSMPFVHELSNPTIEGYGINRSFNESDKRYWHLKCLACNAWTCFDLTFPGCLVRQGKGEDAPVIRVCSKCGRELQLSNPGQWVAEQPSKKDKRGYLVSQLLSHYVSPAKILNEYETKKGYEMETFMRLRLGRAYTLGENRVNKQQIYKLVSSKEIENKNDVLGFMGVDVGKHLHVEIIKRYPAEAIQRICKVSDFEELDALMNKYAITCCVVDALPETREARKFVGRFPGRVFMCYYNDNQKGSYKWNLKEGIVEVNRTESIDASQADFMHEPYIAINCNQADLVEYAQHCEAVVRQISTDEKGSQRVAWVQTGDDHFRHAHNYARIASSKIKSMLRIL